MAEKSWILVSALKFVILIANITFIVIKVKSSTRGKTKTFHQYPMLKYYPKICINLPNHTFKFSTQSLKTLDSLFPHYKGQHCANQ